MKQILITGGAGFLGSHLCDRVIAQGHQVLARDSLFTGSKKNIAGVVVRLDEQRNGLPPDPNAFAVVSDTTGLTPPVPLPNLMPLVIETNCAGYRRFSQGLDWRTLKDGEVLKLPLQKKGWFE